MNIFFLSENPVMAARYQCDKHVVKMPLETAQMLCAAHHLCGGSKSKKLYRLTHKNHPCTKWVRHNSANYEWAYIHFLSLLNEYTLRYGRVHKCNELVGILREVPKRIPVREVISAPARAFDESKYGHSDSIESYRHFYSAEKQDFATWERPYARVPFWWQHWDRWNYKNAA